MGTYTTINKVASLLGLSVFSSSTKPTDTQVEEIIAYWEDYIDQMTGHSWKTKQTDYEYYDVDNFNIIDQNLIVLKLLHRKIKNLDAASGDVLEVWDGSSWVDYLSTKTEGRGNDYWVNNDYGVLHISKQSMGIERIRIKYRYGDSTIPEDIKMACTKYVCADLLLQDDRSFLIPEGANNIQLPDKASKLKADADKIIERRMEFTFIDA